MEDWLSPPSCHLPGKKAVYPGCLAAPGRVAGAHHTRTAHRGATEVRGRWASSRVLRKEEAAGRGGVMAVTTKGMLYK